ncbi:glycosyltransferase [Marinomonas shanghaiensis]|uniref:glycosyltransferase n=1 Tax=Marinomonas shanghaiensis TaxID=2202418 RepID=UPI003A914E6A
MLDKISDSGLFNKAFYEKETGLSYESITEAISDFIQTPLELLKDPHPMFSVEYYLNKYSDIKEAGINPLIHYIEFGAEENREPSPFFKSEYFFSQLSIEERKEAKINPLSYFLLNPSSAKPFFLYDIDFYNSQLSTPVENPILDYLLGEDRNLSLHPLFDVNYYLENNALNFSKAFEDFIRKDNDWIRINPLFDPFYYEARHPDFKNTWLGPHQHYILIGSKIKNWPNPLFWPEYYSGQFNEVDIESFDGKELFHFIIEGDKKGFKPNPWFDPNFYRNMLGWSEESNKSTLAHYLEFGKDNDYLFPSEGFFPKYLRTKYNIPKKYSSLHYYMESITGKKITPPDVWKDSVPEYEQEIFVQKALSSPINEKPKVSVIIPVYNNFEYTLRCIYSLLKTNEKCKYEIILADDGSTDKTFEFFSSIPGLKYIRNAKNLGFLLSCNNAAKQAAGEYIYLLNNDTAVLSGWLDALVETFQFEKGVGLVGSKLLYPNGILQEAGGIIWSNGAANYGKFDDPKKPEYSYLRSADYISGAAILVRRDLWEILGGFDPRYAPAYCEDSDLCLAIRNMGFKVLYQPSSQVVHFEGISSGKDTSSGIKKYQIINSEKLSNKWSQTLKMLGDSGCFKREIVNRSGRPRALIIDATFPTPDQDAGSVTSWHFMKILRNIGYQVTFLPDNLHYMHGYVEDLNSIGVECLYRPYVNDVYSYIEQYGGDFELVMLYRVNHGGRFIEHIKKCASQAKVVFDTVDLHFLRQHREALMESDKEARIAKILFAEETKNRELEIIRLSDISIVLSEHEKIMLSKEHGVDTTAVVPLVLDIPGCAVSFDKREGIAFIGGYQHTPNVDAVLFFVESLWPSIKSRLPGIKFYVIGSKPTVELLSLPEQDPDIVVTGFIESLDPYLDKLKLTVAPLRYGAGIKGKVGSSLSYGVPCVSSKVATEGMGLTHGLDILMSDDMNQFIEDVVEVYKNEALWNKLSKNGLSFVERSYSPKKIQETLSNILYSIQAYPYSSFDYTDRKNVRYRQFEAAPTNKLIGENNSLLTDRIVAEALVGLAEELLEKAVLSIGESKDIFIKNKYHLEVVNTKENLLNKSLFFTDGLDNKSLSIGLLAFEVGKISNDELKLQSQNYDLLLVAIDGSAYSQREIDELQMSYHSSFSNKEVSYSIQRGFQGALGENHLLLSLGVIG